MFDICRSSVFVTIAASSIIFCDRVYSRDPAAPVADAAPSAPPAKTKPTSLQRTEKALIAGGGAQPSPDQAKATFQKRFAEYHAAIREIEKLQIEFQSADSATREKLNATMAGQVAHAQSLMNDLVDAAMTVYRLAPNADPQVTDLLLAVARYYTVGQQVGRGQPNQNGNSNDVYFPIDGGDQYERALPIAQLLIGGSQDKEIIAWGFLAAYMTGDFELASQYLDQLQKSGGIPAVMEAVSKSDKNNTQAGLQQNVEHLLTSSVENFEQYREFWVQESALREAEAKADDLPRVKLTTTKGEIVVELFENQAPGTVANFLTLVKDGFYNGSPFHRVLPGFMVQGGAKTDDGAGGPGYTIRCECTRPDYRRHFRGTLSMAHAGPDTGNSQFFLTTVPTAHLNGRHTAFGRVIEGMEVLGDLQRRSPQHESNPPKADRIIKAEVIRDRGHEYKFERRPE
jgi:cyclophilin family peptidyl-prolyl cis-trans isomerase